MSHIESWGRFRVEARERRGEDLARLTEGAVLSRGLGRSYGDSSFPPPAGADTQTVVNTTLADRVLGFDPECGLLRAEAGLSLHAINQLFLPQRWFVPVTPGTQYVTLGGMVASDVHGKNHHRDGCFGAHVTELTLRVADGRLVTCSPDVERDLFLATVGGMGLTGHILTVAFAMRRIPSPWIYQETRRVPDIDAYMDALTESAERWPYTVGWIDCLTRGRHLGRGILYCGRWAEESEAPPGPPRPKRRVTMPLELPSWALSRLSARLGNALLYRKHPRRTLRGVVHPETFYYPLDKVLRWNRLYGRRGFTQYQCVLPREAGRAAVRSFLELLTAAGGASFLCVIKDCGAEGEGTLSFPLEGTSVALDVPLRAGTPALVERLNAFVIEAGGRIYLTKDSFTTAESFRAMEPRLDAFLAVRRRWDPELRIRSAQSVRLFGDPA